MNNILLYSVARNLWTEGKCFKKLYGILSGPGLELFEHLKLFRIIFYQTWCYRAEIKIVLVSVGSIIDNPIRDMGISNLRIRKGISKIYISRL